MNERNTPPEFCLKVLHRLQKAGVLDGVIVIGSWCSYFYRLKIPGAGMLGAIHTGDIDFLVPKPSMIKTSARLSAELYEMGLRSRFTRLC